ncbi:MAG: bifunctional pyr operon transcriptional regulator/uracil phosphoribosyltransferase PyrR [Cyanobacteria bacterium QS_8_64_29]|nr:MAG: bifunctional pyr operon transcriptional regulator/uracil phosphoribosyltransferase PyrR [Cyanobacteria bacterium QS_8_64_29]
MSAAEIEILSAEEIRRTLKRLASQLVEVAPTLDRLAPIGVQTRGVPLARSLAEQIERLEEVRLPVGALDVTFYRDDLDRVGMRPPAQSDIPCDLTGRIVVLVDDVIYRGRTVRAALNAITEYGRPEAIWLVVLVDRGHRQLPIHPDFTGKTLPTALEEQVQVALEATDGRTAVTLQKAPPD